jgi:hypothetical protein
VAFSRLHECLILCVFAGSPPTDSKQPEAHSKEFKALLAAQEIDDGVTEVVPLSLLQMSNDEQMSKLFDLLRKLPDIIHYYLVSGFCSHALPRCPNAL